MPGIHGFCSLFPFGAIRGKPLLRPTALIEAYWKSVAWPGEGVFIGEPLAHPYSPSLSNASPDTVGLNIFLPKQKLARLEESQSPIGPYSTVSTYHLMAGMNKFNVPLPKKDFHYRIVY